MPNAPSRHSSLRASSSDSARNLVASPKHSGKQPGSRAGRACRCARLLRRRAAVSRRCSGSIRRESVGLVEQKHAVDPSARMRGRLDISEVAFGRRPPRRRHQLRDAAVAWHGSRTTRLLGQLLVGYHRVVDELRELHARFDRIVVGEMQLRHRVQVRSRCESGAQEARGALQSAV